MQRLLFDPHLDARMIVAVPQCQHAFVHGDSGVSNSVAEFYGGLAAA
jgi:hypothetical protein